MFGTAVLGTGWVRGGGLRRVRRLGFGLLMASLLATLAGATAVTAAASPLADFSGPAYQILAPGDFGGLFVNASRGPIRANGELRRFRSRSRPHSSPSGNPSR
jgi:hypothetical protein